MAGAESRRDRARLDRRRFLLWMAGAGAAAAVLPAIGAWAKAAGARSGLTPSGTLETSRAWRSMGTLVEVRVPDLPPAEAVEAIGRVRRRLEALEAAMTLYRAESPLVAWNAAPEGRWVDSPADLVDAVARAAAARADTGGAFDPTVAPALRAWGLYDRDHDHRGRDADPRALAWWRSRPGMDAIDIDRGGLRLRRLDARVEVDLGGIGKGIAVDAALAALRKAGSTAAIVNLGGEIGVLGAPADRPQGWSVGIAHPRRPGEICAEFPLRRGHLATSGDFERWVATPSGRKHHLLDPGTGFPTRGLASLTVWAPTGVEADILSTAWFVRVARGETPLDAARFHLLREEGGELWAWGRLTMSS